MNYWLFKSEPDAWSWEQQLARGEAGEPWSGVRNHLAQQQMKAMRIGDLGFFYHSNIGKEIVGVVEVCQEYQPDPSDELYKSQIDLHEQSPSNNSFGRSGDVMNGALAENSGGFSKDKMFKWGCVYVKAVKPLPKPVTLAQVKATPSLAQMKLVTMSRLSVQPVTEEEWFIILKMGGV